MLSEKTATTDGLAFLPARPDFSPTRCALVVEAGYGQPARRLAAALDILTLVGETSGVARAGADPHERTFIRHADAAFHGSELDLVLRSGGVTAVVLAGDLGRAMRDASEALSRGYAAAVLVEPAEAPAAEYLSNALFGKGAGPAIVSLSELEAAWRAETAPHRPWHAEPKDQALLPTLAARLVPAHTALVIIDMQNFFCRAPGGSLDDLIEIDRAVGVARSLLDEARASGCRVIFVQAEYGPMFRGPGQPRGYLAPSGEGAVYTAAASEWREGSGPRSEVCTHGSWGEALVDELAPRPGELILRKHRFSAFVDTGLDAVLRREGVRSLVVAGVVTNTCVESTVRDAVMRDFYVAVASDAVGQRDSNRTFHDYALREIALDFARTVPSAAVADIWRRGRSEGAPS